MTKYEWSKANHAKGLCYHCKAPVVTGRALCQKHLDMDKLSSQAQRVKRKESGRCPDCSRPALPGMIRCVCVEFKNNQLGYRDKASRGDYGTNK